MLFGQKRADPYFSTKPEVPDYLKGRSLIDVSKDLRKGIMTANQIRIEAFEYNGVLVSTNTRGLAALSLAGKRPTNVTVIPNEALSRRKKNRLNERTLLGDRLPAARIPVTESRNNLDYLYIVEVP